MNLSKVYKFIYDMYDRVVISVRTSTSRVILIKEVQVDSSQVSLLYYNSRFASRIILSPHIFALAMDELT